MADVGAFFKKTLPAMAITVASGLPGPTGAVAQMLQQVLGDKLKIKADAKSINAAVEGATPEQIIELRKLDQQHEETMVKMGFEDKAAMEELGIKDRVDARDLQKTRPSLMPAVITIISALGFFLTLGLIAHYGINPQVHDIVVSMVSVEGMMTGSCVAFWVGSSHGSDKKTDALVSAAAQ